MDHTPRMIPPPPVLLKVDRVCLDRGGQQVLRSVSFDLCAGEFLGLIGPNGGGKTTLLRILLGLLAPNSGSVNWRDVGLGLPRIGYVPQKVSLDSHCPFAAGAMVELGARGRWPLFGKRAAATKLRARELMDRVGLRLSSHQPFVQLSGGQQRRVLLARALMDQPQVLLLDEPTAGVDARGQEQFVQILRELSREGIAVVLVSHDLPLITAHADRIACLCISLHWHGLAGLLDQVTVEEAYQCELQRYQIRPAVCDAHTRNHPIQGTRS